MARITQNRDRDLPIALYWLDDWCRESDHQALHRLVVLHCPVETEYRAYPTDVDRNEHELREPIV